MAVEGVIHLFKPSGPSSAQFAYRLRPILGERRVGHAGALDPFAEGVLVVCVGKATRLVERLMGLPKTYETSLMLGVTNATFDPEHAFEPVPGAADPGRAAVERALAGMIGDVEQAPPRYSAVKIGGVASYARARGRGRAGDQDDRQPAPRLVRIDELTIRRFEWPQLDLTIRCGRGTYIRAIARDLGAALGCGACCTMLRRTRVGPFGIEEAVDLRTARHEQVRAALRSSEQIAALLG